MRGFVSKILEKQQRNLMENPINKSIVILQSYYNNLFIIIIINLRAQSIIGTL